jgi:hypothetical protein
MTLRGAALDQAVALTPTAGAIERPADRVRNA